ncbi:hypothetical protein VIGAN_10142200 [Vigna angularis var. angularis]|uniref:Uncharacterized protein n=1 Tax=Vigna angularis var. angularis TaxID=157739 RepID=A0A0S3T494_PHAAN|nr:hypothetical protein VIGAN_10142200 [Vigna angularis var. angularis]
MPLFATDKKLNFSRNWYVSKSSHMPSTLSLMVFVPHKFSNVSHGSCPHILLKGPSGSGKRELAMALLREIYGDACYYVCFFP